MGDNVYLGDRNGVRTPMQWSADRNAGFSRANPQRLILPINIDPEYHYEAINVEAQQNNPNSLLWWTKRLIALRKQFQAFGRGTHGVPDAANYRVLAFVRQLGGRDDPGGGQPVAVRAVRRAGPEQVEGDRAPSSCSGTPSSRPSASCPTCSRWAGTRSTGSRSSRPPADETPIWRRSYTPPVLSVRQPRKPVARRGSGALEDALPAFLYTRRWFAGRASRVTAARIEDVGGPGRDVFLVIVRVEYADGEAERYVLPLAVVPTAARRPAAGAQAHGGVAELPAGDAVLVDALEDGAIGARAAGGASRSNAGARRRPLATCRRRLLARRAAGRRAHQHQRRSTRRPPSATATLSAEDVSPPGRGHQPRAGADRFLNARAPGLAPDGGGRHRIAARPRRAEHAGGAAGVRPQRGDRLDARARGAAPLLRARR